MKRSISILMISILIFVILNIFLKSLNPYILYINSNSYLPENSLRFKLSSNQVEAIIDSFNLEMEVNQNNQSVIIKQKEVDISNNSITLESIKMPLIEERDLRNIWVTRNKEFIETYMFKESEEFGAYTIMKFVTLEDKSEEVIFTGTYDIDENNRVTLSFIRELVGDELEVISKKEYWSASKNEVFLTLTQENREMQMKVIGD